MEKIFLETSFFIRYFTADDRKKFKDCVRLLEIIEKEGKIRSYTSNIVMLEILFVLGRVYKFSKKDVLNAIQKILNLRNHTLIEKTDTERALALFKKYNIKYVDCLIATQLSKDTKLVSYDEEFAKIKTLNTVTPKDLL